MMRIKLIWLPMLALVLNAFCADTTRRADRFGDLYECYIITDVEVSEYTVDYYEEVDCEDFMRILARGRKEYISFYPAWEANLYDDDGIRYKIYISQSGTFFRIDSDSFRLSKRLRNRLLNIIMM